MVFVQQGAVRDVFNMRFKINEEIMIFLKSIVSLDHLHWDIPGRPENLSF